MGRLNDELRRSEIYFHAPTQHESVPIDQQSFVAFSDDGLDYNRGIQVPVDQAAGNIGPYDMQLALERGQVGLVGASESVAAELGESPETELWAVVYDIDDNNRIDFGDFSFFAGAFGKNAGPPSPQSPFVWWADFDKGSSGRVDFGDLAFFAPNFGKTRGDVQSGAQTLIFPPNFPDAWRALPTAPNGEGEAMVAGDLQQPSFAGAGMLAGFDSLQEAQVPGLRGSSASEDTQGLVRREQPATGLGVRVPVAADAMFAQIGIAEAERTPAWLRPRVATAGHGSRLIEATQTPESPVTLHSRNASSVAAPAERAHRWSERWEPLEDLLSLLADEAHDRLLDPHDALFAQAGG